MQLIPATPYQTGSQAEHRLFRKLQEAFYAESHFIAFHSLNLTRHAYKRFSEIDFLLLCPYGLYVLEVKGGGVSHQQGCWYTLDRNRQQHAIQHPFKQAQTALSAVLEKIGSAPDREGLQIASGYGVVFPDVEWQHSGAEWDRELVCDFRRFRDCEKWLQQLFRYWHRKPGNAHCLSAEQIQDLSRFLRPDFEQVESLSARLDHLQHQQVVLTEEQYRYLDIAVANPRVLCSGGAGTGKTLLAAELARRLAAEKCQVLLLCKSGWLRSYLAARILLENVMLSTLDSVVLDSRRAGITRYDVLIVDEGQDLFTWPAMAVMDDWLTGGLADGEWYIFHDANHQSGLLDETRTEELTDVLESLKRHAPAQLPLTLNCRNSAPIIHHIEYLLQVQIGQRGLGYGPAVRECLAAPAAGGEILAREIEHLLQQGVDACGITILSPLAYEHSSAARLPPAMQRHLMQLDDYSVRQLPLKAISFAEIRHFKGLENQVIIVVDLPHPERLDSQHNRASHYVALTRAASLLVIIWSAT